MDDNCEQQLPNVFTTADSNGGETTVILGVWVWPADEVN